MLSKHFLSFHNPQLYKDSFSKIILLGLHFNIILNTGPCVNIFFSKRKKVKITSTEYIKKNEIIVAQIDICIKHPPEKVSVLRKQCYSFDIARCMNGFFS